MIVLADDPALSTEAFAELYRAAWGADAGPYVQSVLPRSLAWLGAFAGETLVGFVNVAWDGGVHAFLLDTMVHPSWRRQGIARRMVQRASALARDRGAAWLHVDYEPQLESFYSGCGFRPTAAGLIRLAE